MPKLKLMHSVKSIQEAITCLSPVGPVCIQEAKTHSFREPAEAPMKPEDHSLFLHTSESIPKDLLTSHRFFFSPCTTKSIMEEVKATTLPKGFFCDQSVAMAVTSFNPYRDFRASMEEMVAAHGVRDWPHMQELLHCYLKLNDTRTHSIIVLAFVDVFMCIVAQDKDTLLSSSTTT